MTDTGSRLCIILCW